MSCLSTLKVEGKDWNLIQKSEQACWELGTVVCEDV